MGVLGLCLLGLPLAGCGSIDKGAAIRADEEIYASVAKPPGLHLRSRQEEPLTGGGFDDSSIGQGTVGWDIAYTFDTKRSVDSVYYFTRMRLPANWKCRSDAYPGGICFSPDWAKYVAINQGYVSVTHAHSSRSTPLPHTVRIEVSAYNQDQTTDGYPAHGTPNYP
jgi:hypothetical protein